MNRSNWPKKLVTSIALVLLGMLISWAIFAGGAGRLLRMSRGSTAQAAFDAPSISARPVPFDPAAPTEYHKCAPIEVAVYPERIHVRCSAPGPPGNIYFFALGTTDSSHTARVLSILSMAHVASQNLGITYDAGDISGEDIGCLSGDCRLIQIVNMHP